MACSDGEEVPNNRTEFRAWSDLPEEILVKIIIHHSLCDRIRFRAVCKGWRLPLDLVRGLSPISKLPWTMEYTWRKLPDSDRTLSICKLREPDLHRADGSRPRSYVVEIGMVEGRSDFVDAEACASREGWVLFSKEERKWKRWLFFFFSPFTKQVVSLPPLEGSRYAIATFSSAPTSPDCVVFVMHPLEEESVKICVYRPCGNDRRWNSYVFDVPWAHRSVESVAYMGGTFYCHFGFFSRMASFNPANYEWKIIEIADSPNYNNDQIIDDSSAFRFSNPNYLLECEGELLLAYAANDYLGLLDDELFYMFRLDWETKEWQWKAEGRIRNVGLRGGAIFLGKTSFWIPGGGETEMVADRVLHYSRGIPKFYLAVEAPITMDDSDSYYDSWEGPCFWWDGQNIEERKAERKSCYHPCTEGLKTIWISPPPMN